MEEQTGFLGISDAAWGVIGILLLAALVVMAFITDIGPQIS
jgi:hypothetical protein